MKITLGEIVYDDIVSLSFVEDVLEFWFINEYGHSTTVEINLKDQPYEFTIKKNVWRSKK